MNVFPGRRRNTKAIRYRCMVARWLRDLEEEIVFKWGIGDRGMGMMWVGGGLFGDTCQTGVRC